MARFSCLLTLRQQCKGPQTRILPVYVGPVKLAAFFVCGPWLYIVVFKLFSIFGAVGLFRSDMLLIYFCLSTTIA